MIIETKVRGEKFAFDDRSIVGILNDGGSRIKILLYGTVDPIFAAMTYDEALAILKEAQSRDRITDTKPSKSEQKKFEPVIVGAHKFKIDIRTTEYEDGMSSTLHLYTNFELKDDGLKEVIKSVEGISDSLTYGYSRYETSISIGKMFDAELVRQNLENNLIMYLQA